MKLDENMQTNPVKWLSKRGSDKIIKIEDCD